MVDSDGDALEDALARSRPGRGYGVWLEHLRGGHSAFGGASALYPPDMSEWQSAVYLLTGNDGVWGELGGRVMHERSIGPVIAEPESQRRWVTARRLRQRIPPTLTVSGAGS